MVLHRTAQLAASIAAILLLATACVPEPPAPTPTPTQVTPTPSPSGEALISILVPADGAAVTVPVAMSGASNTFEAALTVDALNDAGDELCIRHIMATSGTGTPGTWETRLALAPGAASMPVTLRAYELSAKDGAIINLVEREVMVSPVRPPIVMTAPTCGQVVAPGATFVVEGLATVFEAMFSVELRDLSGAVVLRKELMSQEGGVESGFADSITLPADLPLGLYDLVAFDNSAKDGSVIYEFPVQIRVQNPAG